MSLYLLESKIVDFILHTGTDPLKPMRSISKYSYNKNELLSSGSCSRYGPTSPLDKFHEALNLNHPFAFVGKPCDISAIRQLSKIDRKVNKFCKFWSVKGINPSLINVKKVTIPIKIHKNEDKIIQLKFFIILNILNIR